MGPPDPRLGQSSITLMSDVNNPLCGALGATAVFGPQKGVTAAEVAMLDAILGRFAALTEEALGVSAATRPGAGAAGGLGFALQLIGGTFRSGAAVVADLNGLTARSPAPTGC
jgi:glycerate kinase